jgi:hypothetical protein
VLWKSFLSVIFFFMVLLMVPSLVMLLLYALCNARASVNY